MFITKKHIPRRAFLRGAGVTLALPLLESMFPALVPTAKAQATTKIPRFVGIFNPHGWEPGHWAMKEGTLDDLPFILKPLEPWKDSMTVISGLDATSSCPPRVRLEGVIPVAPQPSAGFNRRKRSARTFIWA